MAPRVPALGQTPSILFITSTRIGDAVLSTGLLGYLTDHYPGARFTIAAGPLPAPLFGHVPGLERLIALTKRSHSRHWVDLYRAVIGRRWDLIVDLRGSGIAWLLRARHRRMIAKGEPGKHRVLQLATLFGLEPAPAPRLWLTAAEDAAAESLIPDGPLVLGIAPTANWLGKQWRAERFAELALRLTAPGAPLAGARIALFTAPNERAMAESFIAAAPPERLIEVTRETYLPNVAAALKRLTLFVGNDSGLMHMAAAVGVPTLGLFGPSPMVKYSPWGPHTEVAATEIPYEVLCSGPDFDHRTTGTLMDSLSVDRVEAAALALLRRSLGAAA